VGCVDGADGKGNPDTWRGGGERREEAGSWMRVRTGSQAQVAHVGGKNPHGVQVDEPDGARQDVELVLMGCDVTCGVCGTGRGGSVLRWQRQRRRQLRPSFRWISGRKAMLRWRVDSGRGRVRLTGGDWGVGGATGAGDCARAGSCGGMTLECRGLKFWFGTNDWFCEDGFGTNLLGSLGALGSSLKALGE
jgi:hypothetical protein